MDSFAEAGYLVIGMSAWHSPASLFGLSLTILQALTTSEE